MQILFSHSTSPYFNIAAEEYLLKQSVKDILFLYVNDQSVIVGKHQNTLAEINYKYIVKNAIPIARRISGGGTVFHDRGNLNYSFLVNTILGRQINFNEYINYIMKALAEYQITVLKKGKNDLRIDRYKISGNAGHVYKNRVLYHGTLLIDTDLKKLSNCLKTHSHYYISKAIPSIRSRVTNLNRYNRHLTVESMIDTLKRKFHNYEIILSDFDIEKIEILKNAKYTLNSWIFGYSPPYNFVKSSNIYGKINLSVQKGIIVSANIENYPVLATNFIGKMHEYSEILNIVKSNSLPITSIWDFF